MANPTGTRRDSRIHLQLRHSDALQEQEAFRRKCLLVNKHITKLNAGLNLRVEELNVQITQLNAENIALRSKVIELTSKLAAEQAATRRTASEAETLTANAIRQLTALKDAFAGLSTPAPAIATHLPTPGPREPVARTALAKPPEVSFIREATVEIEDVPVSRQPSTSRIFTQASPIDLAPSPSSSTPSPPSATAFVTSRRAAHRPTKTAEPDSEPPATPAIPKSSHRTVPRAASPPPVPALEIDTVSSEAEVEEELAPPAVVPSVRASAKERPRTGVGIGRQRAQVDEPMPSVGTSTSRRKVVEKENDMDAVREESGEETHRASMARKPAKRRPLTPPPPPSPKPTTTSDDLHARPAEDPTDGESDAAPAEPLRERRARPSINYALPKLNTKMRKPENYDSKPERTHSAPRVSTSGSSASASRTPGPKRRPPADGQQTDREEQGEREMGERSEDEGAAAGTEVGRKASKARRHTMGM